MMSWPETRAAIARSARLLAVAHALAPGIAQAGNWGSGNWGEMVWGLGAPIPVPALSPRGLVLAAGIALVAGAVAAQRRRRTRPPNRSR